MEPEAHQSQTLHVDPVCGMPVHPEFAVRRLDWHGRMFWFCSEGCYAVFLDDPEEYAPPADA